MTPDELTEMPTSHMSLTCPSAGDRGTRSA